GAGPSTSRRISSRCPAWARRRPAARRPGSGAATRRGSSKRTATRPGRRGLFWRRRRKCSWRVFVPAPPAAVEGLERCGRGPVTMSDGYTGPSLPPPHGPLAAQCRFGPVAAAIGGGAGAMGPRLLGHGPLLADLSRGRRRDGAEHTRPAHRPPRRAERAQTARAPAREPLVLRARLTTSARP